MITKVVTVKPTDTVKEALAALEKKHLRCAPVIDKTGKLVGMFSLHIILRNMLPVSVVMEDGLNKLDFVIGAHPTISRKLKKMQPKKVSDVMATEIVVLNPETPTWEAIRLLVKYGSPLSVVNQENGNLLGIMSEQSVIDEMINFKE